MCGGGGGINNNMNTSNIQYDVYTNSISNEVAQCQKHLELINWFLSINIHMNFN